MLSKDTRTGNKMRNWHCPCMSGKKFKHCCWDQHNSLSEDEPSPLTLAKQCNVDRYYAKKYAEMTR